ncbi:MAG: GAF domain-containing protein [Rhizobiaceae bacterium]|nr:GAF domain-containing protein [Rhizobiaceae bacterium]
MAGRLADPARNAVVESLLAVGLQRDNDFDRIAGMAATTLAAPVALVSLVGRDRQWFKSGLGLDLAETPIEQSFCAHALESADDMLVVPDATADARFATNLLVTGRHNVRFYVGVPLTVNDQRVGSLCVIDRVAREPPTAAQVATLRALAAIVASLFALKEGAHRGAIASAALVHEEKRRAIALEAASLSSWIWDVETGQVECDESLTVLFGLPPRRSMAGAAFFRAIDRRDARRTNDAFRRAIADGDDYFGEYRVRGATPSRWLAARGRVVERAPDGRPLLVFGVNYDITRRKDDEERQTLLLRELNHRVKNTLATVQALATQTVRHARDPREFLGAFSARLQALGAAHGLLSDHEWRNISLRELARTEVQPFDDPRRTRIAISGPDVTLTPDQALGLGIVLHELASNALKYGALSVPDGSVALGWQRAGRGAERRLVMRWSEHGGPPVEPPSRTGFGNILIQRSLAKVLDSEIRHEFRGSGVVADISFPMTE